MKNRWYIFIRKRGAGRGRGRGRLVGPVGARGKGSGAGRAVTGQQIAPGSTSFTMTVDPAPAGYDYFAYNPYYNTWYKPVSVTPVSGAAALDNADMEASNFGGASSASLPPASLLPASPSQRPARGPAAAVPPETSWDYCDPSDYVLEDAYTYPAADRSGDQTTGWWGQAGSRQYEEAPAPAVTSKSYTTGGGRGRRAEMPAEETLAAKEAQDVAEAIRLSMLGVDTPAEGREDAAAEEGGAADDGSDDGGPGSGGSAGSAAGSAASRVREEPSDAAASTFDHPTGPSERLSSGRRGLPAPGSTLEQMAASGIGVSSRGRDDPRVSSSNAVDEEPLPRPTGKGKKKKKQPSKGAAGQSGTPAGASESLARSTSALSEEFLVSGSEAVPAALEAVGVGSERSTLADRPGEATLSSFDSNNSFYKSSWPNTEGDPSVLDNTEMEFDNLSGASMPSSSVAPTQQGSPPRWGRSGGYYTTPAEHAGTDAVWTDRWGRPRQYSAAEDERYRKAQERLAALEEKDMAEAIRLSMADQGEAGAVNQEGPAEQEGTATVKQGGITPMGQGAGADQKRMTAERGESACGDDTAERGESACGDDSGSGDSIRGSATLYSLQEPSAHRVMPTAPIADPIDMPLSREKEGTSKMSKKAVSSGDAVAQSPHAHDFQSLRVHDYQSPRVHDYGRPAALTTDVLGDKEELHHSRNKTTSGKPAKASGEYEASYASASDAGISARFAPVGTAEYPGLHDEFETSGTAPALTAPVAATAKVKKSPRTDSAPSFSNSGSTVKVPSRSDVPDSSARDDAEFEPTSLSAVSHEAAQRRAQTGRSARSAIGSHDDHLPMEDYTSSSVPGTGVGQTGQWGQAAAPTERYRRVPARYAREEEALAAREAREMAEALRLSLLSAEQGGTSSENQEAMPEQEGAARTEQRAIRTTGKRVGSPASSSSRIGTNKDATTSRDEQTSTLQAKAPRGNSSAVLTRPRSTSSFKPVKPSKESSERHRSSTSPVTSEFAGRAASAVGVARPSSKKSTAKVSGNSLAVQYAGTEPRTNKSSRADSARDVSLSSATSSILSSGTSTCSSVSNEENDLSSRLTRMDERSKPSTPQGSSKPAGRSSKSRITEKPSRSARAKCPTSNTASATSSFSSSVSNTDLPYDVGESSSAVAVAGISDASSDNLSNIPPSFGSLGASSYRGGGGSRARAGSGSTPGRRLHGYHTASSGLQGTGQPDSRLGDSNVSDRSSEGKWGSLGDGGVLGRELGTTQRANTAPRVSRAAAEKAIAEREKNAMVAARTAPDRQGDEERQREELRQRRLAYFVGK